MEFISAHAPQSIARPIMLQSWKSLTFLHWRYDPAVIQRLLPPGLKVDAFDGAAWIGLVPFLLVNLRLPFLPAAPWVSRFPETNVRTYVRGPDGKPGVWFFTLDADRLAAVLGARLFYHLPYRWADMRVLEKGDVFTYQSERRRPFGKGFTNIAVRPGLPLPSSQFDNFLTARFRLYSFGRKRLFQADIEHHPWPLQHAEILRLDQNLIECSGVPKAAGQPVVHFARNLDVRVASLKSAELPSDVALPQRQRSTGSLIGHSA